MDTSVLLDVFGADTQYGLSSKAMLKRCVNEGRVIACAVVFAEVIAAFDRAEAARHALEAIPVDFDDVEIEAATLGAEVFREYHRRGGKRERMVADFLIGAHATRRSDRLLTRDRGFHRTYFQGLEVLDPST